MIRHLVQPDGSSLCGQTCVAMAADVSLDKAIEAVGHQKQRGTQTREIVRGLKALGIRCAPRLKPAKHKIPVLPPRCMVVCRRPGSEKRRELWHWMLIWDGKVYDPSTWAPFKDWEIRSYLEIYS